MSQPVRQVIKEMHPELSAKPFYTLMVDGNNLLRQCMADTKINSEGIHYGGIFQFFLQIKLLLREFQYDYVYVVFDDTDSGILRYQLYNDYKANRDKNYAKHLISDEEESDYWKRLNRTIKGMERAIYNKKKKKKDDEDLTEEEKIEKEARRRKKEIADENFERERNIIMMYCVEMYIRVLFDDKTEGDDFIAYYVLHKRPEERVVIVSTDEDLTQLISPTVNVYNRMIKKYLKPSNFKNIKGYPQENVLVKKIMCGDQSDNIGNIKGLSEARLFELMPEMAERPVTVEEIKARAKEKIDERIEQKKKPLQWCENIVNGVSNKTYDGDFYEINEKIIDLNHPLLTKSAIEDIEAMMYAPIDPEGRSFINLYSMIKRDGIEDLMDEKSFSNFFVEFNHLANREKRRFKEATTEKEKFSVIIAGSRDFEDYELLKSVCDRMLSEKKLTHDIVIISGGARGADSLGEKYAEENGFAIDRHPADWERDGKSAGYIRNKEMAEVADACICFWDGESKGTKHMIDIATDMGLKLKIVNYNKQ